MRYTLTVLFAFAMTTLAAQGDKINFGIKAGLNYGDNGKIEYADFDNTRTNLLEEDGDARTGYHVGVFVRANLAAGLFLRPELQYTQTSTEYDLLGSSAKYKLQKIDAPLLVGYKVVGPLYVMAGPSLQYIVNNDLEEVKLDDVKNSFTVGLQFGIGAQLGPLNADIRYERGLSDNQAELIENDIVAVRVDARANQFILSLGLDL